MADADVDVDADQLARAEAYFAAHTPPAGLEETARRVRGFVAGLGAPRRVALVTSGGTKVELERNAVRFIDNFSSGTRGAASVEYLLSRGYAVVFLRRRGSVAPHARHLQAALGCAGPHLGPELLDALAPAPGGAAALELRLGGAADPAARARALEALEAHARHRRAGSLLRVEFETLTEYLFYLRACTRALGAAGPRAMLYFAAAVSDFYVPEADMATHKIQSADGPMRLSLEQTPKLLGCIRHAWAPLAFCVSFKLETDPAILMRKAEGAMAAYGMDAVVANELHSRARAATVLFRDPAGGPPRRAEVTNTDATTGAPAEIESVLVGTLAERHSELLASAASE